MITFLSLCRLSIKLHSPNSLYNFGQIKVHKMKSEKKAKRVPKMWPDIQDKENAIFSKGTKYAQCVPSRYLSSSIQVTGSLLERNGISPQILLFQPGLWVKVCCVYYCTLVLNLFFLLQSNDDVIVTSTEGCCVLYFNLVFE